MKKIQAGLMIGLTALSITAFRNSGELKENSEKKSFLEASSIDSSIKPGDNFWLFANGSWNKNVIIPGTETSIGSFTDLRKANREALRSICEEAANSSAANGSAEQQVGTFYASAMDTVTIDKLGYQPIETYLNQVQKLGSTGALMLWVASQQAEGNAYLYNFGVHPDDKNASKMIAGFSQGGLGLPDRDYYFKNDAESKNIRLKYNAYIRSLFELTGDNQQQAAQNAKAVMALETGIAKGHFTNIELRDPEANYNKFLFSRLSSFTPAINWTAGFRALHLKQDSFLVAQPKFFKNLNTILTTTPLAAWKQYLRFHVISDAAQYMSAAFEKTRFDFYDKTLSGQQLQQPREERIGAQIDATFGEALGQLYVKKYFDESAKNRMQSLVNNLQEVYAKRISNLDWMSDITKQKALAKLAAFVKKIGYPDKWKTYPVELTRNDYFGNLSRFSKWAYADNIEKQGKPVDKTEWEMTPPTINAYYNPVNNEIVFPAGILQFPFFDPKADDAINYGGIGMVIGHEMTHGFDDQGAQYDKDGNLRNWWAAADNAKFKKKVNQVILQYDGYTVLDTLHVKGALTVGENLADIGGLAIAYEAFKNTEQGKKNEMIDGFTSDQRFFLSFSQIWRMKVKDERTRQLIQGDPHSPAMWRVNGPVSNFTPWYTAFGIKEADKMYKPLAQRISVW